MTSFIIAATVGAAVGLLFVVLFHTIAELYRRD